MKISKRALFDNLNETLWKGNGRCDIIEDGGALVYETPSPTLDRWMAEWLELYNKNNPHLQMRLKAVEDNTHYDLEVIKPKQVCFPSVKDMPEEELEVDEDDAGEVARESEVEEEDEWMEVYTKSLFAHHTENPAHKPYYDHTYYMCWGGGPVGGYITKGDKVYRVNRTFAEPYTIEPVDAILDINEDNETIYIRLIK
jgi:hypothetical protein